RATCVVIPMRVADQEDLHVREVETEFRDTVLDQRHGTLQAAVDEDVSFGRGDQVRGQSPRADIVQVAGDAMRREWLSPACGVLRCAPHSECRNERAANRK